LHEVPDGRLAPTVAALMEHRSAPVRRAAMGAVSASWGRTATAMSLAALEDPDDGVRVAALANIRRLGAVEEAVVHKVERFLTGAVSAGDDVCAVGAALLSQASPAACTHAIALLIRVVETRTRGVASLLRGGSSWVPSSFVVATAARALLAIGGEHGKA